VGEVIGTHSIDPAPRRDRSPSPNQRESGMLAAFEISHALRWHVVALVGNDQPIPGGERHDVVAARQGLQGDHVDDPADLRPTPTELAAFEHAVKQIPASRWLGLTATPYAVTSSMI
jgi:hypothetical protein